MTSRNKRYDRKTSKTPVHVLKTGGHNLQVSSFESMNFQGSLFIRDFSLVTFLFIYFYICLYKLSSLFSRLSISLWRARTSGTLIYCRSFYMTELKGDNFISQDHVADTIKVSIFESFTTIQCGVPSTARHDAIVVYNEKS